MLRQLVIEQLQEEIDKRTTEAVNVRALQFQTVDQLALNQVEKLSEARALLDAQRTVQSVFLKLSKPEQAPAEVKTPSKTDRKAMY